MENFFEGFHCRRNALNTFKSIFAREDDYWHSNACLSWYDDHFELYVTGYKASADALVEKVLCRKGSADNLVFPIVFLYRHYLELRLKSFIALGKKMKIIDSGVVFSHSLSELWPASKSVILSAISDKKDHELVDNIKRVIDEFIAVDKASTAFRYNKRKDGTNSVGAIECINLKLLSDVIGGVADVFEGVFSQLTEEAIHRND